MKFEIGDLVTPKEMYLGHGDVFIITRIALVNDIIKYTIEKFHDIKQKVRTSGNVYWMDTELELIASHKNMESIANSTPNITLYEIMMDFAKDYEADRVPQLRAFHSNEMGSHPHTQVIFSTPEKLKQMNETLNCLTDKFENIKEGNNMKTILELYERKIKNKIETEYEKERKEIQKNDVVQTIIAEMESQIEAILGEENIHEKHFYCLDLYTEATKEKMKELFAKKEVQLTELRHKIDEIEALLELAPNYEQKIQILRDYEIVDKKKNIIL